MNDKPSALARAQQLCQRVPPKLVHRVRQRIYPFAQAVRDNYSFCEPSVTGSAFAYHTREIHGYTFCVQGYNEWRSLAVAQAVCQPGDCIIEIGANLGIETISFADIVGHSGRVVAFEPVPELRDVITRNLQRNQQHHVEVLPYAVAEAERTVQFQRATGEHSTGTGKIASDPSDKQETFEVACVSLDQLAPRLPAPRLLHIDVEGAEPLVLQGAQQIIARHRPTIILEVSRSHLEQFSTTPADLLATLRQMGYRVFMLRSLVGRQAPPVNTRRLNNWIAVSSDQPDLLRRITAHVHLAGWLPRNSPTNPLNSTARRNHL